MSQITRVRSLRPPSRLPLGQAGAVQDDGRRAPGRHRRPVRRHPGRPGSRADPEGAGRRGRLARAIRRCGARPRCATRSPAGWSGRLGAQRRHPPPTCCRSSAPRSWWPGCRPSWASAPATRSRYPRLAYPTYEVGARLAGAEPVVYDDPTELDPAGLKLLWLNSPSNPTGRVLSQGRADAGSSPGRASTACWSSATSATWSWAGRPTRSPCCTRTSAAARTRASSPSTRSPSAPTSPATARRSSPATPAVLGDLLQIRKHGGMMTSAPVQAATVAALGDDAHVARAARALRGPPRRAARRPSRPHGFRIEHSEASLYLWATRDEPCWDTVAHLADLRHPRGPRRLLRRGGRAVRPRRLHGDGRAGGGGGAPAGGREPPPRTDAHGRTTREGARESDSPGPCASYGRLPAGQRPPSGQAAEQALGRRRAGPGATRPGPWSSGSALVGDAVLGDRADQRSPPRRRPSARAGMAFFTAVPAVLHGAGASFVAALLPAAFTRPTPSRAVWSSGLAGVAARPGRSARRGSGRPAVPAALAEPAAPTTGAAPAATSSAARAIRRVRGRDMVLL